MLRACSNAALQGSSEPQPPRSKAPAQFWQQHPGTGGQGALDFPLHLVHSEKKSQKRRADVPKATLLDARSVLGGTPRGHLS